MSDNNFESPMDAHETDAPETDAPETDAPKTAAAETDAPESDAADSHIALTEIASPDTAEADTTAGRRALGIPALVTAVVFAALYGYILKDAIGNLILLPQAYASQKLDASLVPWWILIVGVATPVIVFVVAILLGRRRTQLQRVALLVVGLCVLACITVGSIAFVGSN